MMLLIREVKKVRTFRRHCLVMVPLFDRLWVCFGKLQWSVMEMIQESMRQSMWVAYNTLKYQSLGFTTN